MNILNFFNNLFIKLIGNERFLSMQLDITNSCNLSCIHCYHPDHKNVKALALNQWLDIIGQYDLLVNKLGLRPHIIISGGESVGRVGGRQQ